jgi:hypothetical protein
MAVPLVLVVLGWLVVSGGLGTGGSGPLASSQGVDATPSPRPTTETAGVTVAGPTRTAAPPGTIQPTPTTAAAAVAAEPTPRAQPAPRPGNTVAASDGSDPAAAVAGFYDLVSRHAFHDAAQMWSPRMQAAFPPAENIDARFRQTNAITLQQAETVSESGSSAVVAVDLVESTASGPRRYVGRWHLVRTASGWLLDQPELQQAQ